MSCVTLERLEELDGGVPVQRLVVWKQVLGRLARPLLDVVNPADIDSSCDNAMRVPEIPPQYAWPVALRYKELQPQLHSLHSTALR